MDIGGFVFIVEVGVEVSFWLAEVLVVVFGKVGIRGEMELREELN